MKELNHSFNTNIAKVIGVPKAIILKELRGWVLEWKGEEFIWIPKERKCLQELIGCIKLGMKKKNIDISMENLKNSFTVFLDSVYGLKDKFYYKNFFTPSGLLSQFSKILNQIINERGTEKKRNIGKLFTKISG